MSRPDHALVPVTERARWTTGVRAGLALIALALALTLPVAHPLPQHAGPSLTSPAGLAALAGWVLLGASVPWVARRGRRWVLAGLDATLLLDNLVLAALLWPLGGLNWATSMLFTLHAAAVTLVLSFRTGLRIALAHSVVVLCLVQAELVGAVPAFARAGGPTTATVPFGQAYPLFVIALWATTLGTATFAAANERELRRRRVDAEGLQRLLADLARPGDPPSLAARLARFGVEELSATRSVVIVEGSAGPLVVRAPHEAAPHGTPGDPAGQACLREARTQARSLVLAEFDDTREPWLAALLPAAGGVVVVPFTCDGRHGWWILEVGGRRRRGVERRLLTTAEQAAAHTAMALSRAEAVQDLRRAAQLDGLTGVANRRALDAALTRQVDLARSRRSPLSLLLIDIDHFKQVNDRLGHQEGDEVLRAVARALRSATEPGHLVGRYGGEEFAVLLPAETAGRAQVVAERIRQAVRTCTDPPVTCSVGVAELAGPAGPSDVTVLLGRADEALYRAKDGGRDRVVLAATDTAPPGPAQRPRRQERPAPRVR